MLFHCFYDSYNIVAKYFQNALIEFVQTLPRLRKLWQVHPPLSDFFKKLLVQRNTKINEKRNGVITLLWRLWLQENPDHKKVSSLYNTAVVTFFPYLYSRRHSWRSNLGGIPPKKSSRATLKQNTCLWGHVLLTRLKMYLKIRLKLSLKTLEKKTYTWHKNSSS